MIALRFTMLAALVLSAGCAPQKTVGRGMIRVAAASDLQGMLPELAEAFRASSGTEVVLTFGASGQLAEQIKAGAPFDVYLAANRKYVADLAGKGLIRRESVASYAVGSLVLAVHEGAGELKNLQDLTRADVKKIAIANPDFAPYGTAARQALRAAGLWDSLQPKIVLAETVRQTLHYVQTGNVEAGLVSKAAAREPGLRVIEIDPGLYDPIIQDMGIVEDSKNRNDAERFCAFLLGEKGQSLFASHGFGKPPKALP